MTRWKALPDELDPQVGEFVEVMRRAVDRAGLSVAAVADRTGYGRSSWERYLHGGLLAPKGAVVALAEVTGTPAVHLVTLWELAERAWSRSEIRREAITATAGTLPARALPGQFGPPSSPSSPSSPLSPPGGERDRPGARAGGAARQRAALFLAGVVGVAGVAAGAFFLADGRDPHAAGVAESPSPSAAAPRVLPSGVQCGGSDCTGRDAQTTGCSGGLAATAKTATVGATRVEVRYSRTCGAAWGRITPAGPGDTVTVTAGSVRRTGQVSAPGATIAYTPMVAVSSANEATACAVLASGQQGCTP
ncbi:helix-turn-helix domain-containing protein [Streptomyces rishiriensis]|uniref:helix-turn-helix domain-containing protein n=1 Tax=Streptomyces rishiriensis TaxID=68264 RepID=UPI000D598EF0|nr:XRE family transcriptional regulator [Streptomyces rishiriensis]